MSVTSRKKLLTKLRNKTYRDAYIEEHVKTSLPIQVRTLREQREWTQSQLAQASKTTQTVISRLEDPDYGNLSVNSLLKLASGFDVALLVKFVPYSRLLEEFKDVSPGAITAQSFNEEIEKLTEWTDEEIPSADLLYMGIATQSTVKGNVVLVFPTGEPLIPTRAIPVDEPEYDHVSTDEGTAALGLARVAV
jgi:transcriptional regulator with XRE-family HTH domain